MATGQTPRRADAAEELGSSNFQKKEIRAARFGGSKGIDLINRADGVAAEIQRTIFGQDEVAEFVQDRVQAWAMNVDRSDQPTVLNLLGLQGTGKGAMIEVVAEHMGVPLISIDSQQYADNQIDFGRKILNDLRPYIRAGQPVILQINETDKLFEVSETDGTRITHPLIGLLNEMIEEGTLPIEKGSDKKLRLKNVLIAMTMNLAPADVDRFAAKKFYEMNYDDFAEMDRRMHADPHLRYVLLSHLFRANTVDRIAPFTALMKSWLSPSARKALAESAMNREVAKHTDNAAARIRVRWSPSVLDFFVQAYTFAPGGSRGFTNFVERLTQQVLLVGLRVPVEGSQDGDRPRSIDLDMVESKLRISVVDFKRHNSVLTESGSALVDLSYDATKQRWQIPRDLPAIADVQASVAEVRDRGLTKKQIRAARFPPKTQQLKGLTKYLNTIFFGRQAEIDILASDLSRYLARRGRTQKTVTQRTFAGLHGEGKSELPEMAAKFLGLPVIRISLKDYASHEIDAKLKLEERLASALERARDESEDGQNPKYVLIFDELDKLREIDDQGHAQTPPAMGLINALLSEGFVETSNDDYDTMKIDIRDAYVLFTMNFKHDLLELSADPRLTTPQDVRTAMDRTFESPAATYEILKTLFVPPTISRFLPFLTIVKSLNEKEFHKLAQAKAAEAIAEYFQTAPTDTDSGFTPAGTKDPIKTFESVEDFLKDAGLGDLVEDFDGDEADDQLDDAAPKVAVKHPGLISAASVDVQLAQSYTKYLYAETIVPSEGGRYTTLAVHQRVGSDVDQAMRAFPQNSPYAGDPIRLFLEFDPATSSVTSSFVPLADLKMERIPIEKHAVVRMFKPLNTDGPIDLYRMHVSVHEYGHAFFSMLFGFRFTSVLVASLEPGTGGVVHFPVEPSLGANQLLAELLMFLGSRAMERAILSSDPTDPRSVFEASADGPSEDIKQATRQLYQMLHELGLNPFGGTIDRSGGESTGESFATFEALSSEDISLLRTVLRRLENELVRILKKDFTKSWLKQKITRLAKAGRMTEAEFYALHKYPYPGANLEFIGGRSPALQLFKDVVVAETETVRVARNHQRGSRAMTAQQYLDEVTNTLMKWLAKSAGGTLPAADCEETLKPTGAQAP